MQQFSQDVLETFVMETQERLDGLEQSLLSLEQAAPGEIGDLVHSVFRDAHSIKAGANLLELRTIERLAHRLENVLDRMRQGHMLPDEDMITVMLSSVDRLRELADAPEESDGMDIDADLEALGYLLED